MVSTRSDTEHTTHTRDNRTTGTRGQPRSGSFSLASPTHAVAQPNRKRAYFGASPTPSTVRDRAPVCRAAPSRRSPTRRTARAVFRLPEDATTTTAVHRDRNRPAPHGRRP